ncbi:MAG: Clp protease N-terminal domain-containing protein [Actinomycetota bacterium]
MPGEAISLAQVEARRLMKSSMGSEHLLLGLIRHREGVGGKVLVLLGVELDEARGLVESIFGRGRRPSDGLRLTSDWKAVLGAAEEDARVLNHSIVSTAHLLLGLVREPQARGHQVLKAMGVDLGRMRELARKEVRDIEDPGGFVDFVRRLS